MNAFSRFHRRSLLLLCIFGAIVVAALLSAFTTASGTVAVQGAAECSGPFYNFNALGPGFSILAPGTGAPGNGGTCASCHTSYADNSGPGVLTFEVGNGITEFLPGQTYPVKITLSQVNVNAMNFQLTTRDEGSSTAVAGTFSLTEPVRTKLTNGNFGGAGKTYVEGTACGIDVLTLGYNEWNLLWKAPDNPQGDVTFYLGAVAADFNNHQSGDHCYSTQLTISEASTVGMRSGSLFGNGLRVWRTGNEREYAVVSAKETGVVVTNALGQPVMATRFASGKHLLNLESLPAGVYFVCDDEAPQPRGTKIVLW